MHPELLNNSLFLRYYKQWQDDPDSIVFAPIAEYFLMYGLVDPALKICREGIKRHPNLVSGRIVMARVHLRRGNWDEAENELRRVLSIVSDNGTARRMMDEIDVQRRAEREGLRPEPRVHAPAAEVSEITRDPSWETVTMAGILARQGHGERAREIYLSILEGDPANEAAKAGMAVLDR